MDAGPGAGESVGLRGVSHAVATGRFTSGGLRVGTPGPWAGRAKGRRPGACP